MMEADTAQKCSHDDDDDDDDVVYFSYILLYKQKELIHNIEVIRINYLFNSRGEG